MQSSLEHQLCVDTIAPRRVCNIITNLRANIKVPGFLFLFSSLLIRLLLVACRCTGSGARARFLAWQRRYHAAYLDARDPVTCRACDFVRCSAHLIPVRSGFDHISEIIDNLTREGLKTSLQTPSG